MFSLFMSVFQSLLGKVLIAINPHGIISGAYSDETKQNYRNNCGNDLPPHVYLIGKIIFFMNFCKQLKKKSSNFEQRMRS